MTEVRIVTEAERVRAAIEQTEGIQRGEAFASDGFWMGLSDVPAGAVTGWHHHGDFETYVYVTSGVLRLDFGPGGRSCVEVHEGDFVYIPAHLVHRESTADPAAGVVVRTGGSGPTVINVDGPAD